MEEFFDKYFSKDLSELKGLKIKGTIPFNDAIVNDFLQEELTNYQQDAPPERKNWVYVKLLEHTTMKAVSEQGRVVLQVDLAIE